METPKSAQTDDAGKSTAPGTEPEQAPVPVPKEEGVPLAAEVAAKAAADATAEATAEAAAVTAEAEPTPAEVKPAPVTISEETAKAMLDAWLAAQNKGDLAAYSAFYAERFYGVKRSGPRVYHFDRKDWLEDRAKMFKKPMVVEATDVVISTSPYNVLIGFTQTWTSGNYKDVGPKQLITVKDGADGLQIAREEMLSSTEIGSKSGKELDSKDFHFVIEENDEKYVVLSQTPEEEWTDTEHLELLHRDVAVRAPAVMSAVPEALAAWKGAEVDLFGESGQSCAGRVGALYVLVRFQPHFGMTESWSGDPDFGDEGPYTDEQVASSAWSIGGQTAMLVARVEADDVGCDDPFWARAKGQPAPSIYESLPVDAELEAKVTTAFRKLPAYLAIQEPFAESSEEEFASDKPELWDGYEDGVMEFSAFKDPKSGRKYVFVSVSAGYGCGDFYGALWSGWEVKGEGAKATLELVTDPDDPGDLFLPAALIDLDGDGTFELLERERLLQKTEYGLTNTQDVAKPSYDCPC